MAANNSNTSSYEKAMKEASKSGGSVLFNFKKTYPAYIILILTLVGSVFVRSFVTKSIDNDMRASFDKAAGSVMTRLNQNYLSDLQVISSMQGLFQKTYVVRDIFELNASVPTSTNEAIININYVRRVKKEKLEDFVYNTMSQGYFDIKIHPEGQRDTYFPVEFLFPFDRNAQISGYDYLTNENFKEVYEESIKESKIVATKFHDLRKDTLGFLLMAPVYVKDMPVRTPEEKEQNFAAFIMMEINSSKFFENIFVKNKIATDETVLLNIYEANGSKDKPLYQSKDYNKINNGFKPNLEETVDFKIANKTLKVHIATIPDFGGPMQAYLPNIALAGSVLTSFVLFAFIISVITSRARALDLAERITRDQRRIVDSSQDIIAVLSIDGIWKSMNPASMGILGLQASDMIDKSINELFKDDEDLQLFKNILEKNETEYTDRVDFEMKTPQGEKKWINWSFTVSKTDNLIYSIGRDVTLEKMAEQDSIIRNKQILLAEQFAREASESKSYFMIKLGHQIRNSLTGIVGYLQLISGKVYETEEELETFVGLAEESTDELFTFVSDLVDRSQQEDAVTNMNVSTLDFDKVADLATSKIDEYIQSGVKITVKVNHGDDDKPARVVADKNLLSEAIVKVYDSLSSGIQTCHFELNVIENPHEGATEIQILGSPNKLVESLIEVYKNNKNHIIDALRHDERDIMLDLAIVESNVRRMNGTMNVDTLGPDGNIVMLTLPLTKQHEQ